MKYQFTEVQLISLLKGTVELYSEYRNRYDKKDSIAAAVADVMEGMDAELMLIADGEKITPTFTPIEEA